MTRVWLSRIEQDAKYDEFVNCSSILRDQILRVKPWNSCSKKKAGPDSYPFILMHCLLGSVIMWEPASAGKSGETKKRNSDSAAAKCHTSFLNLLFAIIKLACFLNSINFEWSRMLWLPVLSLFTNCVHMVYGLSAHPPFCERES